MRALFLAAAFLAAPASARPLQPWEQPKPWEKRDERSLHTEPAIGVRSLFFKPVDFDPGAWAWGAQAKVHLARDWAAQLSVDRVRASRGGVSYRAIPAQVSALFFYPSDGAVAPYLLGGYGWYFWRFDGPAGHTETRSYPHLGGGIELATSDAWALDVSYRFIWSAVYRPLDMDHPWGARYERRASLLAIGLNRRF